MLDNLTNIQIVGVVHGNSTEQATVSNRPSHTFIYKLNGESIYYLRNTPVYLRAGDVLYIPEGESYSFRKTSEGESIYYLVNFHCDTKATEKPMCFSSPLPTPMEPIFRQMELLWNHAQNPSNRYRLYSLFYHLMHVLLQVREKKYCPSDQRKRLEKAVLYMDDHLYQHDLSIAYLASLCEISTVTFRNLFQAQFGESPKKYMIRRRMQMARTLIESGEYQSIQEVAMTVGYEDPLYFSKHFKSYFGFSPSRLRQ